MKINEYEIQKIIKPIIAQFNFKAAYSYLQLLAHPDMPDQDMEDFKMEAESLLVKTLKEAIENGGISCANYSSNFKATFLTDGEIHLDLVLAWEVAYANIDNLIGG